MLQVELWVAGTGIANFKCAVLPTGSNKEAIPLEATVRTMSPLDQILEAKVFQMKAFPVPP
jgi:hypothetical protein